MGGPVGAVYTVMVTLSPEASSTQVSPAGPARGLSLRTLVIIRWLALTGQLAAVLFAHQWLHFDLPLEPCLATILAGCLFNMAAMARLDEPGSRRPDGPTTALQLGFDILQLSVMLALTGGLENPFSLLLVAPVTVAAAALPARPATVLALLALAAITAMYFWSMPIPWRHGVDLQIPALYRLGMGLALAVGVVFTAGYAWRVAHDAERLQHALAATSEVLEREQRLAALGGLAAAAAHELGTPLATIQVAAREMVRATRQDPALAEDAQLILDQAARCRDILRGLSQRPEDGDALYRSITLAALLEEVADPHRGPDLTLSLMVAPDAAELSVRRLPEIVHALFGIVENAADFARAEVEVAARLIDGRIVIEVADDGPGFAPEVIARLGDPFVSRRGRARGRIGAIARRRGAPTSGEGEGLGLGFFIARTLIERTGGRVTVLGPQPRLGAARRFGDGAGLSRSQLAGARVVVDWPQGALAVDP